MSYEGERFAMTETLPGSSDATTDEAQIEAFRNRLGPFVVAAEKTRMPMVFTAAAGLRNKIVFINGAFLELTRFQKEVVLGTDFLALMTKGTDQAAQAEVVAALEGTAEVEPVICYQRGDGTSFWASLFITPVWDEAGNVAQHFISLVDCTAQRESQRHCEMLIDELNHRVKNTLSTVQSITRQALRTTDDAVIIGELIEARLLALARSHDLLTAHSWAGSGLRELIDATLRPFMDSDGRPNRFKLDGPHAQLPPKSTLALGIAFHELATNAVKYGALSVDDGKVEIHWTIETSETGDLLKLVWQEVGGPAVTPPTRKGFGSQILERGLKHELRGQVELAFPPKGVRCSMVLPILDGNVGG